MKESTTEDLLGPVANRALSLAETCADYCLPEDKSPVQDPDHEVSRRERLSRLQTRATNQALSMFHTSVGRAHELLSGLLDSGSHITQVVPTASVATTLTQVVSILGFACSTAKSVSFPLISQGLTTMKETNGKIKWTAQRVVEDTCKAASDAYNWAKAKENLFPILSRIESAAANLAALVKPVVDSSLAHKLDDVACHGTTANLSPVQDPDHEVSRRERLSRLQTRATNQALSMFHTSVGRAHELLSGLLDSGSHITQVVPTASVATTLTQVVSILGFACSTAKSVSFPLISQGLTTMKEQTEKLNGQLKESGKLNWLDLHNVIQGLDRLRTLIDEQPKVETMKCVEMQPIPVQESSQNHTQKVVTNSDDVSADEQTSNPPE
ncbi:hypothetical protein AHF37_06630 [Paragonimus kellicotti]|nr:hypothetical protein AHF37_06630 [Paragonimus kellicotti]